MVNRHSPNDMHPATIAGHSVSLTNLVLALGVPSIFFCRSKIGFLTPREMASALDRLQRRFSTQRRQSIASSISPSLL
jgi:hypothetical protein